VVKTLRMRREAAIPACSSREATGDETLRGRTLPLWGARISRLG
jgi:hypothetical protein